VVLVDRETDEPIAQVPIPVGATVYDAFERAEQRLPTRCRGSSLCGLCRVEVREGSPLPPDPPPDERALLARVAPHEPDARLACRMKLDPRDDRLVVAIDRARWQAARALDRARRG